MSLLRTCVDCGTPSPWTRCALHRKATTRMRTANRTKAQQVIAADTRCEICGSTVDLTGHYPGV